MSKFYSQYKGKNIKNLNLIKLTMKALKDLVHPVKKEFRREKCGFEHTPPDDFVKSQVSFFKNSK